MTTEKEISTRLLIAEAIESELKDKFLFLDIKMLTGTAPCLRVFRTDGSVDFLEVFLDVETVELLAGYENDRNISIDYCDPKLMDVIFEYFNKWIIGGNKTQFGL